MDIKFLPHNSHQENILKFSELDPDLRQLQQHKYIYRFPELEKLPHRPGLYTLTGGFRTGKTTLLKLWIQKLIKEKDPQTIVFISAEMIKTYHELKQILQKQITAMPKDNTIFIIIDEVSTLHNWQKAIKFFVEEKKPDNLVLMLSGSVSKLNIEAKARFHLFPLSFRETIQLKYGTNSPPAATLFDEFRAFLIHGGFLNAINELHTQQKISHHTLKSYFDWIVKESLHNGKHEHYLREIINAIIQHYNQPITWNALAQELTIDHPKTIGDYLSLLEWFDVVFIQYALLEKTLLPAPKKARKLMFTNPFIYHAMHAWLAPQKTNSMSQIQLTIEDPIVCSKLAETSVITAIKRYFPTYYIKDEGEVDLAYIYNRRFWPIEITWSSQMRAKDLKQILKYPNGRILTKTDRSGIIEHIRTEPLPSALWQLEKPLET